MNLPRLHSRVQIVAKARNRIVGAVLEVLRELQEEDDGAGDVTYLELVGIFLDLARTWTTNGIQVDRHPDDPDRRAGWAADDDDDDECTGEDCPTCLEAST